MAIPFGILSQVLGGVPQAPGILSNPDQPLLPYMNNPEFQQAKATEEQVPPVPPVPPALAALQAREPLGVESSLKPFEPQSQQAPAQQEAPRQSYGDKGASNRKALLALGAGLLGGKNFFDGLSSGITAYQGTLDAETEANKPKRTVINGGTHVLTTNRDGTYSIEETPVAEYDLEKTGIAADGRYRQAMAVAEGQDRRQDKSLDANREIAQMQLLASQGDKAATRQLQLEIARGNWANQQEIARFTQSNNNPFAQAKAKADVEYSTKFRDSATQAISKNSMYDRMLGLLDTGGAGAGILNKGIRGAVGTTGVDMFGVKAGDMQELQMGFRNLELDAAQLMDGQGQITQPERQILQQSVPNITTDPAATKRVVDILKKANNRKIQIQDEWENSDQQGYFGDFASKRIKDLTGAKDPDKPKSSSGGWTIKIKE